MKKAILKNSFSEIKKTKSRFFSIFGIVAIGTAFFIGVKAAAPDMKTSADKYYDDYRLMDFRLVSTYGFDDEDISALKNLDIAKTVSPGYFADVLVDTDNDEKVARLMSLDDYGKSNEINGVRLKDGRFPQSENECIVDSSITSSSMEIGSVVTLRSGTDDPLTDAVSCSQLTVVGTFYTPLYVDHLERGSTTISDGTIDVTVYIPESNFTVDYYTEVYIDVDELTPLNSYSDEYSDRLDEIRTMLENVADGREDGRFSTIVDEANEKISDGETELQDAKDKAEKEFADAEKKLDDAKKELDNAKKEIEENEKKLEDAKTQLDDAETQLSDGWDEYYENKDEFDTQMAEALSTLDETDDELTANQAKLDEGYKQYESGLNEYNSKYDEYSAGYDEYKTQYEAFLAKVEEYNTGKQQYDENFSEYSKNYENLQATSVQLAALYEQLKTAIGDYGEDDPKTIALQTAYNEGMDEYTDAYDVLSNAKEQLDAVKEQLDNSKVQLDAANEQFDSTKATLDSAKEQLDASALLLSQTKEKLDTSQKQLNDGKEQLKAGYDAYDSEYDENKTKLDDAYETLCKSQDEYDESLDEYNDGVKKLSDGKDEYKDGLKEYNDGVKEYKSSKDEAEEKISDAENTLKENKEKLKDLTKPVWYIFDRTDNPGNAEYGENADRIDNISKVFPVFFLLVAGLVCLTTMQRMVEEQRTQIGTLKALGYKNGSIMGKYMLYALIATFAGGIFGMSLGQIMFPFVIMTAYGMLYNMAELLMPFYFDMSADALAVCAAAISITVYFSCKNELREVPSQLMRPKSPKNGKRVLLERVNFIWKRMKFNDKVTIRNIFRYKKRMIMTVVGIAGCTALLLTGFALRDSVSDIIGKQYDVLYHYDGMLAYNSDTYDEDSENINKIFDKYNARTMQAYVKQMTVKANGSSVDVFVVVPSNASEFNDYITLRSRINGETYNIDNKGVVATEKMCTLLGIKAGDNVEISLSDTEKATMAVSHITENYARHFVYMSPTVYAELFGSEPVYNSTYFISHLNEQQGERLSEELLKNESIMQISLVSDGYDTFSSMLNALNAVIWVIIACAGILAFVVLYNLTNINITERIREISTLKVLGFYDGEVDNYIFKENIILTLIGGGVGLVLGIFLANFIIKTAEIDMVMFGREIHPQSFVYAFLLTLAFSVLVTVSMHRRMVKIDMVEALKSVE